ncbi:hypothetical protein KCU90_g34, partial [Aureobasidium melanogenum]
MFSILVYLVPTTMTSKLAAGDSIVSSSQRLKMYIFPQELYQKPKKINAVAFTFKKCRSRSPLCDVCKKKKRRKKKKGMKKPKSHRAIFSMYAELFLIAEADPVTGPCRVVELAHVT